MICDICGSDKALVKHTSKLYGKGDNSFIIENVPVVFCSNCGESYLSALTLKEIDRIKKRKDTLFKQKEFSVTEFI
jgi:YgiT-type zinc finger domain-containing protein